LLKYIFAKKIMQGFADEREWGNHQPGKHKKSGGYLIPSDRNKEGFIVKIMRSHIRQQTIREQIDADKVKANAHPPPSREYFDFIQVWLDMGRRREFKPLKAALQIFIDDFPGRYWTVVMS